MTTHTAPHSSPHISGATISADADVPAIVITRDFRATPAQLFRAHTDPDLFARWIGPDSLTALIDHWDARDGGSWRFRHVRGDESFGFRGCFHTVREDTIVQTFTWEGMPDQVSLETLTFTEVGDGVTRLQAVSLCGSFADRDAWLASGMEDGIEEGYAKLEALVRDGACGEDAS